MATILLGLNGLKELTSILGTCWNDVTIVALHIMCSFENDILMYQEFTPLF